MHHVFKFPTVMEISRLHQVVLARRKGLDPKNYPTMGYILKLLACFYKSEHLRLVLLIRECTICVVSGEDDEVLYRLPLPSTQLPCSNGANPNW